jgi:TDG/mug DNA glycosylase family protein
MTPKKLPDIVGPALKVLFVGINPSLRSAELGHHFAGRGNRFWKLIHGSGLFPDPIDFEDDRRMLERGFGLTNIVDRPTVSISDLLPEDYAIGRARLSRKIRRLRPEWVAFVGVTVYRVFFGESGAVSPGPAHASVGSSRVFVLPNPSGRNAHFTFAKMLDAYAALRRTIDQAPRTVTTGQDALRTTSSAMLPSSKREIPVRPFVPITKRS